MKLKISHLAALAACMLTWSCYEDKGNYTYGDIEVIEVTLPEKIEVMQGNPIRISPVVTSSLAGTIGNDNPDYEYSCKLNLPYYDDEGKTVQWTDINPEGTQEINYVASAPANTYLFWYMVKNKSTGVTNNFKGYITVKSATSEGWLVLSNNGPDKKGRLDIVYTDADGNDCVYADINDIYSADYHNATGLVFMPSATTTGDQIFVLSHTGSYDVDKEYLTTRESDNLKGIEFNSSDGVGNIIAYAPVFTGGFKAATRLCVDTEFNAYGIHTSTVGAAFEYLMNTDVPGNEATFKVAPAIGTSQATTSYCALFYDTTNRRFMGSYFDSNAPIASKTLFTLLPPEQPIFSFDTGMEFVDMASSAFSDGDVFTILQDNAGHRHIYVINLAGYTRPTSFNQRALYADINAENFNSATDFAAHSQYTFLFYCYNNKVYCYDYATATVKDVVTLKDNERITMIKFNRFATLRMNPAMQLNKSDEEFLGLENELIVCSSTGETNGGIMRLYKISPQGKMEIHKGHTGLGEEIVDVVYRERRM